MILSSFSSDARRLPCRVLLGAGACGPSLQDARPIPTAPGVPSGAAGKGFYVTQSPDGVLVGGNHDHKKTKPKVTPDFQGPPGTNDWWSSLIWQYENEEPYSYEMFPHPLTLRANAKGLAIGYSDKPTITPREVHVSRTRRISLVGVDGLSRAADSRCVLLGLVGHRRVARRPKRLRATFGHGMPFVYFEKSGAGDAVVNVANQSARA